MMNNVFDFSKEFNNSIMENRPVFVYDFNPDNKQGILISYLMYLEIDKLKERLAKCVNLDDINNNVLLFFDKRHIIELAQMYFGYFKLISHSENDFFAKERTEKVIKKLYIPVKYRDLYSFMDAVCLEIPSVNTNPIKEKIEFINKVIWFIPYSEIDKLILEAIEIYEKENKEVGENNE